MPIAVGQMPESDFRNPFGGHLRQGKGHEMKSFNDLLDLHRQLDELFFEHQRALMRLDLREAAALLNKYEAELLAHMTDEEELMLPLYRERADEPVGGTAEIFVGEHDKLRQYQSLFKAELAKLPAASDLERGALFLIDSQHLFKRLLVHHDTRERKFLYPLLDQVTSRSEREALGEQLRHPVKRELTAESDQDAKGAWRLMTHA
jgi:hemerythrin-like domain-containing protein